MKLCTILFGSFHQRLYSMEGRHLRQLYFWHCVSFQWASVSKILCRIVGFEPGKYCKAENFRGSIERLKKAEYKSSQKGKKRRSTLKYNKNAKEQSSQDKEGQTYSAGAFY